MADTENNKNSNSPAERAQGNAPALRFPGFTEPWQKCVISQFGDIITGNTPSTKQPENYSSNGNLWASPSDLNVTKYVYDTKTRLSPIGFQKTRIIPKHSILVTCIGSTIGKMGMASTVMSTNQQINTIIVNSSFDKDFVYYAIQSRFPKYLPSIAVQAVPILSKSTFGELENYYPSIIEQKRVGELLSLLDERIATQRRLIDKLESLIKGIREFFFKNASGDLVCLSNIAEIYQPQTISSTELLDNGFPVYGANGIIGYYDSYNHITEQICITCRGNTCGTVNYSLAKSWITGNAMVVNTDSHSDVVSKRFLFHYLSEYNFKSIISGSGQPQIIRSPLQKLKIKLPSLDKQTQIANFLDTILHKIDLEYSELDLLQKRKQHLLQQMFI